MTYQVTPTTCSIWSITYMFCGKCHAMNPKWMFYSSNPDGAKEAVLPFVKEIEEYVGRCDYIDAFYAKSFLDGSSKVHKDEEALLYAILDKALKINRSKNKVSKRNRIQKWLDASGMRNLPSAERMEQAVRLTSERNAVCPICGCKITDRNIKTLSTRKNGSFTFNMQADSCIIEEHEGKTTFAVYVRTCYPVIKKGAIAVNRITYRFCFHEDGRLVFSAPGFDLDHSRKKKGHPQNITNSFIYAEDMCKAAAEESGLWEKVISYYSEKRGEDEYAKTLIENVKKTKATRCDRMNVALIYFRYGTLPEGTMGMLIDFFRRSSFTEPERLKRKRMLAALFQISRNSMGLFAVAQKWGLPMTKSVKRRIVSNPHSLFMMKFLMDCGFRDVNVINRIMDEHIDDTALFDCCMIYGARSRICKTIKDCVSSCTEPTAAKRLFDPHGRNTRHVISLLHEIGRMLDTVNLYRPDTKSLSDLGVKWKDIGYVHDSLSLEINKMSRESVEISYSKKEEDLECEQYGFSIRLPRKTEELWDCGNRMHICVGSYDRMALDKTCTIAFLIHKDGICESEYAGCIELKLDQNGFCLMQAKGYCNQMLGGEAALAVRKWVEEKGIHANLCYDYQNMDFGRGADSMPNDYGDQEIGF